MKESNELKIKDTSNDEIKDSNSLVIEVDNSIQKDPIKKPKNKIFKQVPIEETSEQYEIIESNTICLKIKLFFNYLDKIDKNLSKPLQTYTPNFAIECIFLFFAKLFNTITVIIYLIALLIYSYYYKNYNIFLIYFSHVMTGAFFTVFFKTIIGRNRPSLEVKKHFSYVRNKETGKSMPSGDSLQAANFAIMIILNLECNLKYLTLLLIPGVMCGRVYYNCHYWFDCIIGVILGIIISFGVYFAINKIKLFM